MNATGGAASPPEGPDQSDRPSHWWRWPLLVLAFGIALWQTLVFVLAMTAGHIELGGLFEEQASGAYDPIDVFLALVVPLLWAVPGAIILRRAEWHPVGWFLIVTGIGFGLSFALASAVIWDRFVPLSRPWAAWVADSWGPYVSFTGMILLLSVFPDGLGVRGSIDRRWRVVRISIALGTLVVVALATEVGGFEGNTFSEAYRNPTGLGFIDPGWLQIVAGPVLVLLLISVVSLWRRSRVADVSQHRQYVWVLFPFGMLAVFIALAILVTTLVRSEIAGLAWLPVALSYLAIPVAFSMAIVRYRWFDIDKLVSRTVTYAVVAAASIALYAVPVLVLPELLGLSGDLTVAGATLLAAAAFNPLRIRVQRYVARRFDRARYDAEVLVGEFAGRLQAATDIGTLTEQVRSVVTVALGPRSIDAWFAPQVAESHGAG